MKNFHTELLRQADAFCKKHKITRAKLGAVVMHDNKFFARIGKNGGAFTTRTYEKFQAYFAKQA